MREAWASVDDADRYHSLNEASVFVSNGALFRERAQNFQVGFRTEVIQGYNMCTLSNGPRFLRPNGLSEIRAQGSPPLQVAKLDE